MKKRFFVVIALLVVCMVSGVATAQKKPLVCVVMILFYLPIYAGVNRETSCKNVAPAKLTVPYLWELIKRNQA